MTAQPKWKTVLCTDSWWLKEETTGVYDPTLEVLNEVFADGIDFVLYGFPLERYKYVKGYLVPAEYDASWPHALSQYEPWFADELEEVARSTGRPVEELEADLTSDNPRDLMNAYLDMGGYWGFENFDGYPRTMSEEEVEDYWCPY